MNLIKREEKWYLRKRWDGRQRMVSLKTSVKRDAQTRSNRFLTILDESMDWDTAVADLRGKKVVRKNEDPDHAAIEVLYREYMAQSANPVTAASIKHNLQALRRLMEKCGAKTVSGIRPEKIKFTNENRRYLSSQIGAASSIFKVAALRYYAKRGLRLDNPFKDIETVSKKIDPYIPLSDEQRQKIWSECGKEDAYTELIVLLALGCGLRRNEIDKARVSWLTMQSGKPLLTVKKESDFIPKSRVDRPIPISQELYKRIQSARKRLRPNIDDPYLIPSGDSQSTDLRLMKHYRRISGWLEKTGAKGRNKLHSLRKEFGSLVATKHGIFVASNYLGHSSVVVTQNHYGSLVSLPDVNIGSLIGGDHNNQEAATASLANELGMKVDALAGALARLGLVIMEK